MKLLQQAGEVIRTGAERGSAFITELNLLAGRLLVSDYVIGQAAVVAASAAAGAGVGSVLGYLIDTDTKVKAEDDRTTGMMPAMTGLGTVIGGVVGAALTYAPFVQRFLGQ